MANDNNNGDENADWLVQLEYADPDDGQHGPPEGWPFPSWFNRETGDFYWKERRDPCPVRALGHDETGNYVFVTALRTVRRFTASSLHGGGGPNDLFGGDLSWPLRHFRQWDREKGKAMGGLKKQQLMGAMIKACDRAGYYDNAAAPRSFGTWRGPDGEPVIHCGDVILHNGAIYEPGDMIGDARYVLG